MIVAIGTMVYIFSSVCVVVLHCVVFLVFGTNKRLVAMQTRPLDGIWEVLGIRCSSLT